MSKHSKSGFCQACWNEAFDRALAQPSKSQSEHYVEVLRENQTPPEKKP